MGTLSYVVGNAFLKRKFSWNPNADLYRNDFAYTTIGRDNKTSGTVITLPGGNKFRKATNYWRFTTKITPGASQYTVTDYSGPAVFSSSPGGFQSDILVHGATPPVTSSLGSLTSFIQRPQIPSGMRNEAVTKALLNLADQKAGLTEDILTYRQAVGMLTSPLSSLVNGLKRVHADKDLRPFLNDSARSLRKRGISNAAAQRYLEYVYGFKPLMSDIYGIIDLLKKKSSNSLLVSGHGVSVQDGTVKVADAYDFSAHAYTKFPAPCNEKTIVSCHVWARIDPQFAGIRALNQLGLINPLSLMWELVPWSFVVDWVVPIGSVLQAMSARAGLIFVDGSVSVRDSVVGAFEHWYSITDKSSTDIHANGIIRYAGYYRETLSDFPVPGVYFASDPLTGDRPLKALALAITNLRQLR